MAVSKEKKTQVLEKLKTDLKNVKSLVFTDYRGLSVKDISALRNKLRENNSGYNVAKNTLIKLAAADAGIGELPKELFAGPVAIATNQDDEVIAVKTIYEFAKGNKKLQILGGVVDGVIYDKAQMTDLAMIPSKEELYAKLVGSMNSPIQGFYGVMHGLLSGFVRVVQAVSEKIAENQDAVAIPEETAEVVEEKPAEDAAPAEVAEVEEKAEEAAPTEVAEVEEKAEDAAPAEEPKVEDDKPEEEKPTEAAEA